MFQTACPSCGANVSFRSATSAMAVCEYCHSTLLREADAVRDAGKMSAIIEDYSPIQITACGMCAGQAFQVIGRIQLRYEDGFWNEWYIWLDDGKTGWLSDASGQYVVSFQDGIAEEAQAFAELVPGSTYLYKDNVYFASDVRTARCVAGEGELPFQVGQGWEAKVADFRTGTQFLTLDYSEQTPPERFTGKAYTLDELKMERLRDDSLILEKAGKIKGKTTSLACPSCGSTLSYQAGAAFHLVCPGCSSEIDCSTDQALVLEKHTQQSNVTSTLKLGDVAKIQGVEWQLIGQMKCQEPDPEEPSTWWEYLLYHPNKGFMWLIETDEGWEQVRVLDNWPTRISGNQMPYQNTTFTHLYDYPSKVIYAAGAFNWRVKVGDQTRISDYQKGDQKLTLETSASELNWSMAKKVPAQTVGEWFGKPLAAPEKSSGSTSSISGSPLFGIAKTITWVFIGVNLAVWESYDGSLMVIVAGLVLLWLPVLVSLGRDK
ncbi:DUF4178 domain-containing protein [Leeia oryzae]|uniref:DUF4178 domain-containing protein n=1 Tax=Leeia oryzae TaxID=356662 RepID=UPI0003623A5F|nr:DUF4178 domain-containing protein [Leeia oryzae]